MNQSRKTRWTIRVFCAAVLFFLTLATSGVVQAYITGAGTPCDSCSSRCYAYWAGIDRHKQPNGGPYDNSKGCRMPQGYPYYGMPDTSCLAVKCANWCDGCIPTTVSVIDCENENCWILGANGGSVCSNGCVGIKCDATPYTDKRCGQLPQQCQVGELTLACTKCSCIPY